MPAVHLRDVPGAVLAALRERASHHGWSMQQEMRQVLLEAAAHRVDGGRPEAVALTTVRTGGTSTWSREEIYGGDGTR